MGDFVEKICSEQKTDLIVFPELSHTSVRSLVCVLLTLLSVCWPCLQLSCQALTSSACFVVFGMVIKELLESILYNGVVCLGPEGDVVSDYRKVHLLGEER